MRRLPCALLLAASAVHADPTPAERAAPVANDALDRAYAASKYSPHPAHGHTWVTARQGYASRDGHGGFRVEWSRHGVVGFEYDVTIQVDKDGTTKVLVARAGFSPE
jgi:hypothetical protein